MKAKLTKTSEGKTIGNIFVLSLLKDSAFKLTQGHLEMLSKSNGCKIFLIGDTEIFLKYWLFIKDSPKWSMLKKFCAQKRLKPIWNRFSMLKLQRVGLPVRFPVTSGPVTWLSLLLEILKNSSKVITGNKIRIERRNLTSFRHFRCQEWLPGHHNGYFGLVTPHLYFCHMVSKYLSLVLPVEIHL